MQIKVIGSGCENCSKLYQNTLEALEELNLDASIEKVEDLKEILMLGVISIPAIMIDGRLASSGQVISKNKIKKLIEKNN